MTVTHYVVLLAQQRANLEKLVNLYCSILLTAISIVSSRGMFVKSLNVFTNIPLDDKSKILFVYLLIFMYIYWFLRKTQF